MKPLFEDKEDKKETEKAVTKVENGPEDDKKKTEEKKSETV